MEERIPMTEIGYDKLSDELKRLKGTERPAIIAAIADARSHGDLSENAEYHSAREKQSFIEGRILELESVVGRVNVINVKNIKSDNVVFGATVTLADEEDKEVTYKIVGEYESDAARKEISIKSPVAKALIGKKIGDEVRVNVPAGVKSYEIINIKYV